MKDARAPQGGDDGREELAMCTGEAGQPDRIDVLLYRRLGDLRRCLSQARVDDLETRIAQRPRDHLGPAVVTVQTGLCNQDSLGCRHSARPPSVVSPARPHATSAGKEPVRAVGCGHLANPVGRDARRYDEGDAHTIGEEPQQARWPRAAGTAAGTGVLRAHAALLAVDDARASNSSSRLVCVSQAPCARRAPLLGQAPSALLFGADRP